MIKAGVPMLSSAESRNPGSLPVNVGLAWLKDIATRRIWLPRLAYQALPWFYLSAGICALLASFYVSHWYWILPHYLIFAVACIHLGAFVFRLRSRKTGSKAPGSSA